ncbi:MAG: ABC transporter permease [Saprospiraceae bacterium]
MLKNYLTIALRNLWRNKLYTVINIFGIGIGLATMVWAFQNYNFAFSFDQIHEDQDQIFRVDIFREGNEIPRGICPMPVAMSAKEDFSSVEEVVRYDRQNIAVKSDHAQPFYENVHFVDPSFFELFDYPMVAGSNHIFDKNSIVVTEEMAKKYFGVDESNYKDVLNKTLTIYSSEAHQQILNVIGVIKTPQKIFLSGSKC